MELIFHFGLYMIFLMTDYKGFQGYFDPYSVPNTAFFDNRGHSVKYAEGWDYLTSTQDYEAWKAEFLYMLHSE